jgi:hypothetical protein
LPNGIVPLLKKTDVANVPFGELPFVFMFLIFVLVENPIMFYVCIGCDPNDMLIAI